jgi:hypothetical protein
MGGQVHDIDEVCEKLKAVKHPREPLISATKFNIL